jgi:hypothetical protein
MKRYLQTAADGAWWNTEPIRWLHSNLRETDAALNPKRFIHDVADFNANVLVTAMAGITASFLRPDRETSVFKCRRTRIAAFFGCWSSNISHSLRLTTLIGWESVTPIS